MAFALLMEAGELLATPPAVVFDCRFSLADPDFGHAQYLQGHVPGALFLDMNRDLSGPTSTHGGRHPLPAPEIFAALLSRHGVGPDTDVLGYDDSRFAGAARLWWLMRSIGYRPPRILNGGYRAFLSAGGTPELEISPPATPVKTSVSGFTGYCDIEGLRSLQAEGALLVDSREKRRYLGLEEPIDPVAGHIPGAINRPWQEVSLEDGKMRDLAALREHWGNVLDAEQVVVYCGSGVTACVNLFSLALLGKDDATLYAGSWSDWCSYL